MKWVRGELIASGSQAKIYLGLNVTTGEMIAVKQAERPETASDRADSRQQLMLNTLRSESDVMKDLDHINIVQYLGIEETNEYISM
jgi:serine/threonine protein kinase